MTLIDYTPNTPEEQLAMDEILLLKAEREEVGETLRFWESKDYFVVLGRACKVKEDCLDDTAKIIRRISGGGTVLQGPGCLNYSVILSYETDKNYRSVKASYEAILGRLSNIIKSEGGDAEFHPISDIALEGKKISGNAQARKKNYFLHHGTFLYDFDLDKIPQYLKHPSKEPEYRKGRSHKDFLINLPVKKEKLKELIKEAFSCSGDIWNPEEEDLESLNWLVKEKYESSSWNHAF